MSSPYTVHVAQSMREIDAAQWDACANPEADPNGLFAPTLGAETARRQDQTANDLERFNPFITHAFLNALETSKSVGSRAGWTSAHILVKDARGRLAAAAPAYLKTHSMGEYVFDHGWADAYHR
ncbi:MAG: peptidogalycan biosysnthesis protein, partial [Methylocella sp.]